MWHTLLNKLHVCPCASCASGTYCGWYHKFTRHTLLKVVSSRLGGWYASSAPVRTITIAKVWLVGQLQRAFARVH
jgi:hypothetical protein